MLEREHLERSLPTIRCEATGRTPVGRVMPLAFRLLDPKRLRRVDAYPSKGRDPPPAAPAVATTSFLGPMTIVDSTTLLRRTSMGDAEAAVPARGLSMTQRRILTLLQAPRRLGDLPLAPGVDAQRLRREALRLAQAGFITCEATAVAEIAHAANAPIAVTRTGHSITWKLSTVLVAVAAVLLVWGGWRFSAAPAADATAPAVAVKPAATGTVPATPAPEPSVIATRVLRGDPQERARDAAKDAHAPTPVKTAVAPIANGEALRASGEAATTRATNAALVPPAGSSAAEATHDPVVRVTDDVAAAPRD